MVFNRSGRAQNQPAATKSTAVGTCGPLPLPSQVGASQYELLLNTFITNNCFTKWKQDSEIRDTGPFINGKSYGTHNAVKVYYSPEIWDWLNGKIPQIPDGAIVIKAMYPAPAQQTLTSDYTLQGYAIMVKDASQSWDGWFWTDGSPLTQNSAFNSYPNAGYGLYCINCHASAAKDSTYSTIRNVTGIPMTYTVVVPTMEPSASGASAKAAALTAVQQDLEQDLHLRVSHRRIRSNASVPLMALAPGINPAFVNFFGKMQVNEPNGMPYMSYDHVVQGPQPNGQKPFITSDQCIGCHDATASNAGLPNMLFPRTEGPNLNLSPYGEWRSSMMGLGGRDPIFYAQLESERTLHPELGKEIDNKCLSCHGVTGQRQFVQDNGPEALFTHEMVNATPDNPELEQFAKYGALARDGISCTVCHHISEKGLGTESTYTGKFNVGPPDKLYGQFDDVIELPMKNALGITPAFAPQIKSAALCGSCHIVQVPILNVGQKYTRAQFDHPGQLQHEQSTYFEWRNSIYENEISPNPATAKTCQDCHMKATEDNQFLRFRIANIEDETFADVDNRAPNKDITVKVRGQENSSDTAEPYSRHTLLGVNVFSLEIFRQFTQPLGIWSIDYMVPRNVEPSLTTAVNSSLDQARNESAQIAITKLNRTGNGLSASVEVKNLAGHKFPSGVGFRRAFIELRVTDAQNKTVWVSGATNSIGVIGTYDSSGEFTPLPSEDLKNNTYQPHYATIDSQNKVQIFEELFKDNLGKLTTSFLSLDTQVKDNRLMPQGWTLNGPNCSETIPVGVNDSCKCNQKCSGSYFDESGTDEVSYQIQLPPGTQGPLTVKATLYYQSIPPYYLKQRFDTSQGEATKNLYFYVTRLDVKRTEIADWKLRISNVSKSIP